MESDERIIWSLSLLEANGGGVRKSYFRDKCLALGGLTHSTFYGFIAELRGHEWVKEAEQRDGATWIILTPEGLEELQARRAANA